jgi:GTP cyclohydrolase I
MDDLFDVIENRFKEFYADWEGGVQFEGSGDRLRRLVSEMLWSKKEVDEEIKKCLKAIFPDPYDEMLVVRDINVWTFCPHHILPCNFSVSIGYIPNGRVLGLSKFARIAVAYGKMPIMQEQYTRELSDVFWKGLGPKGLGIYVIGKHGCMGCRGINQELGIVTSHLEGVFLDDQMAREEFLSICRG